MCFVFVMTLREGSLGAKGVCGFTGSSDKEHQMATAPRADRHAAAQAAAAQLAAPSVRNTVASSGGSATTSREPVSHWACASAPPSGRGQHAAVTAAGPAGPFSPVSRATRIPKLATWIAARSNFTFAEAAAASAPSPCSPTVMAYTLPDDRLASALAELGYLVTPGGKNGYTVTAMKDQAGSE
jgi:hypothetical protein